VTADATLPLALTAAVLVLHSVVRTKIVGSRLLARDRYYAAAAARDQEARDRKLAAVFGAEFERRANESRMPPPAAEETVAAAAARAAARARSGGDAPGRPR